MDKETKSFLDAMKDLLSVDEGSLGAAHKAFEKKCEDLHQRIRQKVTQVEADVRTKVHAARIKMVIPPWRRPLQPPYPGHIDGGPLIVEPVVPKPQVTIEDINRSLNELGQLARSFDNYRIPDEGAGESWRKTIQDIDQTLDRIKASRSEQDAPQAASATDTEKES